MRTVEHYNDMVNTTILLAVAEILPRYRIGILQWAAKNRKYLTRIEKKKVAIIVNLIKAKAPEKALVMAVNAWKEVVLEIVDEWEKMIRRL